MVVKRALVFASFVGMGLFVACTDISDLAGGEFVPDTSNLQLNYTDTITIETYSILQDSVLNIRSSPLLIGELNDPIFGKTNASIAAKFLLVNGFDSSFHAAEFFDSIVFSLAYSSDYFGDTNQIQTIRIYELAEILKDDESIFSNYRANYNPLELASYSFQPKPTTPVELLPGDTVSPHIRINISTSASSPFAEKLLNINEEDFYVSNEETGIDSLKLDEFYEYFNGLYISSDEVGTGSIGALIGLNLFNSRTHLTIYKHDTIHGFGADGITDTITIENETSILQIASIGGTALNQYSHDYTSADSEFKNQVLDENKELGKELIYIQSLAGTHTRIKFPFIKNLNALGNKIAVNKAELILTAAEDLMITSFDAPNEIGAQIRFDRDSVLFIPDITYGETFFGGVLDTTDGVNEYKFRITRYLQEVLDGDLEGEDGLYFYSVPEYNVYSRVLLIGSDPALPTPYSKRARLEITYTVVD